MANRDLNHPEGVTLAVADAAKEALTCPDVLRLNVYGGLKRGIILVKAGDGTFGTATWAFEGDDVKFYDVESGLDEEVAENDYRLRGFRLLAEVNGR